MEKLKFNPNNKKYYSKDFIAGFECGVERQFNADREEKTAEWISKDDEPISDWECSNCGFTFYEREKPCYALCPNCGSKMETMNNLFYKYSKEGTYNADDGK